MIKDFSQAVKLAMNEPKTPARLLEDTVRMARQMEASLKQNAPEKSAEQLKGPARLR